MSVVAVGLPSATTATTSATTSSVTQSAPATPDNNTAVVQTPSETAATTTVGNAVAVVNIEPLPRGSAFQPDHFGHTRGFVQNIFGAQTPSRARQPLYQHMTPLPFKRLPHLEQLSTQAGTSTGTTHTSTQLGSRSGANNWNWQQFSEQAAVVERNMESQNTSSINELAIQTDVDNPQLHGEAAVHDDAEEEESQPQETDNTIMQPLDNPPVQSSSSNDDVTPPQATSNEEAEPSGIEASQPPIALSTFLTQTLETWSRKIRVPSTSSPFRLM